MHAADLARRYPQVVVDPDVLYIDHGDVITSAGTAAGLDACLHVVRTDHGAAIGLLAQRITGRRPRRAGSASHRP